MRPDFFRLLPDRQAGRDDARQNPQRVVSLGDKRRTSCGDATPTPKPQRRANAPFGVSGSDFDQIGQRVNRFRIAHAGAGE